VKKVKEKTCLTAFLAAWISFSLLFGANQEKVTIAVFDFEALGVDIASALTISDLMRTELTGIGIWDLVEREKLAKVLKELELQKTGLTQIEKAREIGRILNAEKIILGSVGKLGSMYVVQARLVDVETGKTDLAKKVTCNCPLDEILPAIENLARQVAGVSSEEAIVSSGPTPASKEADLSKMVRIQGGTFRIGLNELGYKILSKLNPYVTQESFASIMPGADVYVDEFYIDRHEVTNGEYKEFCDHTGKPYPPDPGWGGRYANYLKNFPEHPVVNVTWYEAMDFAKWQGKGLPREAEWEMAARFSSMNLWTWGNKWEEGRANLAEPDPYPYTAAVGSMIDDSTASGVVDMVGNVSEWCVDNYLSTYYQGMPSKNPKGPEMGDGKSVRGGNWGSTKLNSILPKRISFPPDGRSDRIGFRCIYRLTR
jgi:formylglycine-generating enzyme required for sulfatase activity